MSPAEKQPKRGEIWTAAGEQDYAGKPRPVIILQDDETFDATNSITICPITTDEAHASIFRLPLTLDAANGLRAPCRAMADKITTVRKAKLGIRIGRLDDGHMSRISQAVILFLGLAPMPRRNQGVSREAPVTKPQAAPKGSA